MTIHKRSTHIDAPVEAVFDHVKDPRRFFEAFIPEQDRAHTAIAEARMAPDDGAGSTVRLLGRMFLLLHVEWTATREEYVPGERIVDRVPSGRLISTFAPDGDGTVLSLAFEWSLSPAVVGHLVDRVWWNGDRDLDRALAALKSAIESGSTHTGPASPPSQRGSTHAGAVMTPRAEGDDPPAQMVGLR